MRLMGKAAGTLTCDRNNLDMVQTPNMCSAHHIFGFATDAKGDDLLPLFMLIREDLLKVRWLLMRDEIQEALLLLEQCHSKAQQHRYFGCLLEAQMFLALVHFRQNNIRMARQILQDVLPALRSKGHRRLYLDEGESMAALFRACGEERGEHPVSLPGHCRRPRKILCPLCFTTSANDLVESGYAAHLACDRRVSCEVSCEAGSKSGCG
jgi:hypothetical protein